MSRPNVFVNVTHPSQLQSQQVQTIVKSYSSKLKIRSSVVRNSSSLLSSGRDGNTHCTELDFSQPANIPNKIKLGVTRSRKEEARNQDFNYPKSEWNEDCRKDVDRDEEVKKRHREGFDDVFGNFGVLPVPYLENYPFRTRLPQLLDHYLHVFGENNVWRTIMAEDSAGPSQRHFFAASMQEPVLLEGVFAICHAHIDLKATPQAPQSVTALWHRGRALSMLQEALKRSPDNISDEVLLAIVAIMTADAICSNWHSFEVNLNGARHIIAMKGGLQNVGWNTWFATIFMWAELRWTCHMARLASNKEVSLSLPIYPTHPFSSDLCKTISELPPGLTDIALSRSLSTQVIDLLQRVSIWTRDWVEHGLSRQMASSQYQKSMQLEITLAKSLGTLRLKHFEQLIVIGTICYLVSSEEFLPNIERPPPGLEDLMVNMEDLCASVNKSSTPTLLWVGIMLAMSSDSAFAPLPNRWILLDRVLHLGSCSDWTWDTVLPMLRRHFWNDLWNLRGDACWQMALEWKLQSHSGLGVERRMSLLQPKELSAVFNKSSLSWDAVPEVHIPR